MRIIMAPARLWHLLDVCVAASRARAAFQDAASAVLHEVEDCCGRDLLDVEVDDGGVIHLALGACHDEVKMWLARGPEIRPVKASGGRREKRT